MSDLREIYLEPECCASQPEGRLWCEHDAPADCPEGTTWTRYIVASDYDALRAEIERLRGLLQGLVDLCHQAGFPCDAAEAALAEVKP